MPNQEVCPIPLGLASAIGVWGEKKPKIQSGRGHQQFLGPPLELETRLQIVKHFIRHIDAKRFERAFHMYPRSAGCWRK